jgi:RNA polymerase sigma-70 factor (ECF subfamily)
MSGVPAVASDPIEELFVRWRDDGDGRALAALFDRTAPDLFRIALSVAPDAATAEEAVQETFLAVIEDPKRCDPSQPLMPWLVGVLRHKVLDARRRARRVPDPLRLEPRLVPEDPADCAERSDAVDRVRRAIDRLPEPYRGAALLRWEYGLEPGEIAHALGEPPGTVRSTLSRALERLRRDLGGAAALALVLGVRPPDGLAAIRRAVLAKAGVTAGGGATAIVVAGVLVGRFAAAAILLVAFAAGGVAGAIASSVSGGDSASRIGAGGVPAETASAPAPRPSARPRRADRGDDQPDAERPDPRNAAPPSGTAAAPSPAASGTAAQVAVVLADLDGRWSTAWRVGQELAHLPSQREVLDALRTAWPTLGDATDRQNLMKGFDYEGTSPLRLDVFDLGARDRDPRVRWFALTYFEPYAGRRLVDAPEAWRAWREETSNASPDALLDAAGESLLAKLRAAAPAERADLLDLLAAVLVRRTTALPSRDAILEAATQWYADPSWTRSPRPLARVIALARPDEPRARALVASLLADGPDGERRALVLAGVLGAHWAWDEIVSRLTSADAETAAAAAGALADLGDVRALEPLVAAFEAHPEGRGAAAIAAALQSLTGVSDWRGKDAAWWRAWWSKNGRDVTSSPAREETR